MLRGAALLAGAAAAAITAFALLPPPVGAGVRAIAVQGSSMAPTLKAGDLAIVVPRESYLPGQVVAYRSPDLGGTVLIHRVVGYDGDRLVLKGDANAFADSYRPSRDEVLGAMAAAMPGAGRALLAIMEPQWAGAAAGGAAAVTVALGRRRRKALHLSPPLVLGGLGVGIALLAAGAGGVLARALLPPTEVARTPVHYGHGGEWSYTAPSLMPVYQDGATARTGEPLFLRLVRPVTFTFRYRPPAEVEGRRGHITLYATVGDYSPTGWRRTIPLAGPVPLQGDETAVTGTLDLAQVTALWQEVAQATGLPLTAARLEVTAQVHLEGDLAGRPLTDDASFSLPFRLDERQAALEPPPDGRVQGLLAPAIDRTAIVPLERPREVGLGAARLPLSTAGRVGLYLLWAGGGVLALAAGAALLALRTPAGLAGLLGAPVVQAEGPAPSEEGAVPVAGVADLVRAARAASAPVLAYPDGSLVVRTAGAAYLWRAAEGRRKGREAPRKGAGA
ncbi:hypothetical protein HRbin24_00153 [bacterium HR24]|nr:hypothetical protein HRbin24_00153 [bacterium HR24]